MKLLLLVICGIILLGCGSREYWKDVGRWEAEKGNPVDDRNCRASLSYYKMLKKGDLSLDEYKSMMNWLYGEVN